MCWLQPQILKHITALRPERKKIKFLSGCLGDQKFWLHNYTLRGSEMLKTFLYCIFLYGIRNSVSSPVLFGGSEILNLLCCLAIRSSESSPVLFGGSEILNLLSCLAIRSSESSPVLSGESEILNPLLCYLGDQKFWIFCVVWGSWILSCVGWGGGAKILNPLLR